MKCTRCGAEIAQGQKFCASCGSPSPSATYCTDCGAEVKQSAQFCASCGRALGIMIAPAATPSAPAAPMYQTPGIRLTAPPTKALAFNRERRSRGPSLLLFWVPYVLLLLLAALFYWAAGVSTVGWAVLVVCFVLVFVFRGALFTRGAFLAICTWVGFFVVLFLTLGSTTPQATSQTANGNKSAANPSPTTSPAAASSGAIKATPAPTATRYTGPPPEALKPLIAALGKQPNQVDYSLTQDGKNSYAYLSLIIRGPVQQLSNWMGDPTWQTNIHFHMEDSDATRALQSQVKSTREDAGFKDDNKIFLPREEKPLGKGDEGYSFVRAWKDQQQASMRTIAARQGTTWFYITAQGDSKNPLVPADGIDILLAELKKIDTRALLATVPTVAATAAPTSAVARPVPTVAAAAGPKVASALFGLGLTPEQKIVNQTGSFKPDVPEIFLSLETSGVISDTAVDVTWVYTTTGDSVKGPTQRINADARVGFSLTKPTGGWAAGDYKVVILLNGKESGSPAFTVQK